MVETYSWVLAISINNFASEVKSGPENTGPDGYVAEIGLYGTHGT